LGEEKGEEGKHYEPVPGPQERGLDAVAITGMRVCATPSEGKGGGGGDVVLSGKNAASSKSSGKRVLGRSGAGGGRKKGAAGLLRLRKGERH